VCVCVCVYVCVCVREREQERERERERERETERERECVCVSMYTESEKMHASERNETHENTARSAPTQRCHHPTRTAVVACGCSPTARCSPGGSRAGLAAACSSCCPSGTGSSQSQSARPWSCRTPESAEGIVWPSVRTHWWLSALTTHSFCARFMLFSHVVWFRSLISPRSWLLERAPKPVAVCIWSASVTTQAPHLRWCRCSNHVHAPFLPNWLPPHSKVLPKSSCLATKVHALWVHPLNLLSLGCWTLLCPLNHLNLTFNYSNLTNWPTNLTTCPVPNHLMIIWIFLAPHLPQCTHHTILPIPRRHGGPDTAQCAPTDNALPFLLAISWRTFSPWICVPVCENAPWRRASNTRRDAPYTQWGLAMQEEMATQDKTAEWRLNSEWPSQLSTPKLFR